MLILTRKYTEKEKTRLLSSIVCYIDSRERSNKWITDAWDKQGIKYEKKKLDFADYSFFVPKNESLGIEEDISFEKLISVERKNSIDELATNFTSKDRDRIKREFERHEGLMILLIEEGSYSKICQADYRSKATPLSIIATLHSWQIEYEVPFVFIDKQYSAQFIYYTFYYYLRNHLKNKQIQL